MKRIQKFKLKLSSKRKPSLYPMVKMQQAYFGKELSIEDTSKNTKVLSKT
jgi:hypothetical protein